MASALGFMVQNEIHLKLLHPDTYVIGSDMSNVASFLLMFLSPLLVKFLHPHRAVTLAALLSLATFVATLFFHSTALVVLFSALTFSLSVFAQTILKSVFLQLIPPTQKGLYQGTLMASKHSVTFLLFWFAALTKTNTPFYIMLGCYALLVGIWVGHIHLSQDIKQQGHQHPVHAFTLKSLLHPLTMFKTQPYVYVIFAFMAIAGNFFSFFARVFEAHGYTIADTSNMRSIGEIGAILFIIVGGKLCDHFAPKKVIRGTLALVILSLFCISFIHSNPLLLKIMIFLMGGLTFSIFANVPVLFTRIVQHDSLYYAISSLTLLNLPLYLLSNQLWHILIDGLPLDSLFMVIGCICAFLMVMVFVLDPKEKRPLIS